MAESERAALLRRFEEAAVAFDRFLDPAAVALADFRPALPDAWTIREHLAHFADNEAHLYARMRFAVAEPGATVAAFDEQKWHERLGGAPQPLAETIRLYRGLRQATARFLRSLPADWEPFHVLHPARGRLSLEQLLRTYTDHLDFHREYIERNERLFGAAR